MNIASIAYILGKLIEIEGILFLLPSLVSLIYKEKEGKVYFAAAVICFLFGYIVTKRKPKKRHDSNLQNSSARLDTTT